MKKGVLTPCILWGGHIRKNGYGQAGKKLAHRYIYEENGGVLIKGMDLDHLCRNRACVNPDHLDQVTRRENILRGEGLPAINARRTHCIRNHEYTPENTRLYRGYRRCRKCNVIEHKLWIERKKIKEGK